ncbi:MAG: PGF-CTERM sorting domain-containing protein, partial [Methanoregula sp.]
FKPSQKSQSGEFSGSSGTVTIEPGSGGMNQWSFDVDASPFRPDEYIVRVSGTVIEVTVSTTFNIFEKMPSTPATLAPSTTLRTASPTTTPSLPPTTTQKSPLSSVTILVAFALVGCALIPERK